MVVNEIFNSASNSELKKEQYLQEEYNKINRMAYNQVASTYDEATKCHAAKEHQRIIEAISYVQGDKDIILDIGCGPARDTKLWEKYGLKYFGIDISDHMLDIAKSKNQNSAFLKADITTVSLKEKNISIAWMSSSFQHVIPELAFSVLEKIYHGLKHGGVLYINYRPLREGLLRSEMRESSEYGNSISRGITHHDGTELEQLLQKIGYTIKKHETYRELYRSYSIEKEKYLPTKKYIFAVKV